MMINMKASAGKRAIEEYAATLMTGNEQQNLTYTDH